MRCGHRDVDPVAGLQIVSDSVLLTLRPVHGTADVAGEISFALFICHERTILVIENIKPLVAPHLHQEVGFGVEVVWSHPVRRADENQRFTHDDIRTHLLTGAADYAAEEVLQHRAVHRVLFCMFEDDNRVVVLDVRNRLRQ